MGLFSRQQNDEKWLGEIRPTFETARLHMLEMNRALQVGSFRERYAAVHSVLDNLPVVEKAVKRVRAPSSREALEVHNLFKSALRNHIQGANIGWALFKNYREPGQHYMSLKRSRLFLSFMASSDKDMEDVSLYMDR